MTSFVYHLIMFVKVCANCMNVLMGPKFFMLCAELHPKNIRHFRNTAFITEVFIMKYQSAIYKLYTGCNSALHAVFFCVGIFLRNYVCAFVCELSSLH